MDNKEAKIIIDHLIKAEEALQNALNELCLDVNSLEVSEHICEAEIDISRSINSLKSASKIC